MMTAPGGDRSAAGSAVAARTGRIAAFAEDRPLVSAAGPIFVGSPQQIVDKLMYERELFGHDRFLAQVDTGGLPYAKVAQSIELLATQVLPAINRT